MAGPLDVTAFNYGLKEKYPEQRIMTQTYSNRPWFAMIPKKTNFGGDSAKVPIRYATVAGISRNGATALSNQGPSTGAAWQVTRAKGFAVASIDYETMLASKGAENGMQKLMSAAEDELDQAIDGISQVIARDLYLDATGTLGSISSITSSVITLTAASDAVNFYVGQKVVFAANVTSALRSATSVAVTAVNFDAGTVTIASTPGGVTSSDEIFQEGDYESASDATGIAGLALHLPASSSPAALFGVTRTADVTRLAGHYRTSAATLKEDLMNLAVDIHTTGGKPNIILMNPKHWASLQNSLQTQVIYSDAKSGAIGFQSLMLMGPAGPMSILADPFCPYGKAYVLTKETWVLHSLGVCPLVLDELGGKFSWSASAMALIARIGYFANQYCVAPGHNGVLTSIA